MIDPRTQYILYKEQENALMAQIERNLATKASHQPGVIAAGKVEKVTGFSLSRVFTFLRRQESKL